MIAGPEVSVLVEGLEIARSSGARVCPPGRKQRIRIPTKLRTILFVGVAGFYSLTARWARKSGA